MSRINDTWFEFCGVSSATYGIKIMSEFSRVLSLERGSVVTAAGRDGTLWMSDESDESIEIKRTIRVPLSQFEAMAAWLSQSGRLRFSHNPARSYSARVNKGRSAKASEFKVVVLGDDPILQGEITFVCDPHSYLYPAASDIVVTTSGTTITNPGTVCSRPRITIVGSGSFSLTIGMQTMFFTDVEDGIIVDTELGDALTSDGALLANDWTDGPLFKIEPGENVVSWLTGGMSDTGATLSGSVTSVTIEPRWRYR